MKTLIEILKEHWEYKSQLFKLAKSDLNKKYGGSALGWAWAFIRPGITIFVFWFALAVGLRSGKNIDCEYPFFLWLVSGMIPWFYMRDMINGGAGSIRKYRFLVTKIKFPIATIPTFVSISNLMIHGILMIALFIIFFIFGYAPTIYWLQIPFYMLLMFIFFTVWGLFSGVLSAMSKDFLNLVRSLVTALFWLSGIIYDPQSIGNTTIENILMFNPVTLMVTGYRNCMVFDTWFWEDSRLLLNYGILLLVMIILAVRSYKKLRRDIPDVL